MAPTPHARIHFSLLAFGAVTVPAAHVHAAYMAALSAAYAQVLSTADLLAAA